MSFKPRNSFYLRISATTVLQLLLYLDARHVEFMTADILERVLSALKPRIVQKLGAELGNTKNKKRREADSEKVDVFRGGECAVTMDAEAKRLTILHRSWMADGTPFRAQYIMPSVLYLCLSVGLLLPKDDP